MSSDAKCKECGRPIRLDENGRSTHFIEVKNKDGWVGWLRLELDHAASEGQEKTENDH